jgi:hypothetical protein
LVLPTRVAITLRISIFSGFVIGSVHLRHEQAGSSIFTLFTSGDAESSVA